MWKPQFLILRLCYTPYGIGLSAFAGVALLGRVIGKSRLREKLLSFLLMVFFCIPLFGYLLNGGLYSKNKVFIRFFRSSVQKSGFMWKTSLSGSGSVEKIKAPGISRGKP